MTKGHHLWNRNVVKVNAWPIEYFTIPNSTIYRGSPKHSAIMVATWVSNGRINYSPKRIYNELAIQRKKFFTIVVQVVKLARFAYCKLRAINYPNYIRKTTLLLKLSDIDKRLSLIRKRHHSWSQKTNNRINYHI